MLAEKEVKMEFIKKNGVKIILAALSLCCAILVLVPVFIMENFNFKGASQTIGLIVFFAGTAAVLCLKMFDKVRSIGKYVLLGAGIFALIFLSIGAAGLSKTEAQGPIGKAYAYFANVEKNVNDGEEKLNASKTQVEDLKALNAGIEAGLKVSVASGGLLEMAGMKVENLPADAEWTNGAVCDII